MNLFGRLDECPKCGAGFSVSSDQASSTVSGHTPSGPSGPAHESVEQRVGRVFVSSTFRDMNAEREELVKRVFPKLRKLCEQRGVVWGEVDLRWGITDQQAAEGQVLPICLAEIERCRPFFIGLLGSRYGWVPDAVDAELLSQEPWLEEHLERSITELEILHGVLNNPDMTDRAFFYFRDPAYVESLPAAERDGYLEVPDTRDIEKHGLEEAERRARERAQKLESLKERIRRSDATVCEGYTDPETLGDRVLHDLTAAIDRTFPLESRPEPLVRDRAEHAAFAQSRTNVYVGRQAYMDRLDEHAAGEGPPLVVVGESGSGKSALLANWAARDCDAPAHDEVILHLIGASAQSSDWVAMLQRIMGELGHRFGIHQDITDEPDELSSEFANWLHMAGTQASRQGCRIVLIIDALDQLEDRGGARDLVWLPPAMPENIRLIVSTLPGRPLEALKRRAWPTLEVERLAVEERAELIQEYLGQYTKELSPKRAQRIAESDQAGNPLYLRGLLEELRLCGEHERLDEQIDHYLAAEDIPALYAQMLSRYERDYERGRPGLVRDTMTHLWAARRGLSETELLELLGTGGEPLPHLYWSPLHLAVEHGLVSRSGLITFSHDHLREAVARKYVPNAEQLVAHRRLANYFESLPLSQRTLDEFPWQLAAAQCWDRLRSLLANIEFVHEMWQSQSGQNDAFECWRKLSENSDSRVVDVYAHVLQSPTDFLPFLPTLLSLLRMRGHYIEVVALSDEQANAARTQGDEAALSAALLSKASALLMSDDQYDRVSAVLDEAEPLAHRLRDPRVSARCLNLRGTVLVHTGGSPEDLLEVRRETLSILRGAGVPEWELATDLHNVGAALARLGDGQGARETYREAEAIARGQGDLDSVARSLMGRGLAEEQFLDRLPLLRDAEDIYRRLGKGLGIANALRYQVANLLRIHAGPGQAALTPEDVRVFEAEGIPKAEEASALFANLGMHEYASELDGKIETMRELSTSSASMLDMVEDMGLSELFEACMSDEDDEEIMAEFGLFGGPDGDWEEPDEPLPDTLAISPDAPSRATAVSREAQALISRGQLDAAASILEQQEQECRGTGDLRGLCEILNSQGRILFMRGDLRQALAQEEEIEALCRELGDSNGLQATLGNQASMLWADGNAGDALALLQQQESICRETDNRKGLSYALNTKSRILLGTGDLIEALDVLEEQVALCRERNDARGLADGLTGMGFALATLADPEDALALFVESEELSRQSGDAEQLAATLDTHALVLCQEMGQPDTAEPLAEEALRVARKYGVVGLAQQIEMNLEMIRSRRG